MSTVTVTRFVEAHAADLWRLLTDLGLRSDRPDALGPVEVLTTGRFGPGTAWRETRSHPDGSPLVEEFLVIEAEPPRRLVLSSPGSGVDYRITWTLRSVRRRRRGCTAVTVTQEAVPVAPYGRVVAFLLGGLAARAVEGALRRDLADLVAATRRRTSEAA
ncbi:SRPBCC family protein [Micromonospora endolithica]|uniref:SRPBCC family protein n=1 Tax=Micromonospora endolithica TaxID=230091 RepID=A0A3A9YS91_9ACTN|nr:SRPBCC family protein [Micromonospora endolithica]RKN38860.1 SRPBCC family protein [Micromonospora endolithica]TWJ25485.1 polyketide cyclase/dehydrase/lipid transport protein [Micromonospora endolithica]